MTLLEERFYNSINHVCHELMDKNTAGAISNTAEAINRIADALSSIDISLKVLSNRMTNLDVTRMELREKDEASHKKLAEENK